MDFVEVQNNGETGASETPELTEPETTTTQSCAGEPKGQPESPHEQNQSDTESDSTAMADITQTPSPTQEDGEVTGEEGPKSIALHAEFVSFLELRDAIDRYQRENFVQLIVKDSKLLKSESTRKIIPKVYHLVNQDLMYHSITYCCKCHGELRQKPNTRIKNIGAKRLNCPMYLRLKLTADLQRLILYDINETHNHGIDPTTCLMTPRQQVYTLSRLRQGKPDYDHKPAVSTQPALDYGSLVANAIKDVSSVSCTNYEPSAKVPRIKKELRDDEEPEEADNHPGISASGPDSPLDSESSFSDSEEEEVAVRRRLLPFPIRLIGSAVQSSPELLASTRQLIELQKSNLELEKQKLLLETKKLELSNMKLELEVKKMERNLASDLAEAEQAQDTTIYLQAS